MRHTFLSLCLFFVAVVTFAQQQTELRRSKTVFLNEAFQKGRILQTFNRHVDDSVNIFLKDGEVIGKDGKKHTIIINYDGKTEK